MASNNYTVAQDGKVFTLSGPEMTRDFNQMKRECCGRYDNFIFPDAKKVVDLLKKQGRSHMTHEEVMEVFMREEVHTQSIMILFIVTIVLIKRDYRNYMFSPDDGENKDNHYSSTKV